MERSCRASRGRHWWEPAFAHSNLDVGQIYAIVSQQMPLTAPASLSKADYAAVMAYMLAYGCVKSTGDGKPFPLTPPPQVANVKVGTSTCPI